METVVERLERLYKTENLTPNDRSWLADYLKGDISELYLIALEGFSKDVLEKKIMLNEYASGEMLKNIHERITKTPQQVFPMRKLLLKMALAASVAAVFCTGYVFRKQLDNWIDPVTYQETVALNGELKMISLSDGTTICLNAGSRLSYPDKFKQNTREVTLTGEAFFKVAHNSSKPFIIHSGKINTTVLGTSFNVKAYEEDKAIKVTVVSGKVGVIAKGVTVKHPPVLLTPNMQLVYTKTNETLVAQKIDDASLVISWQQGKLQYHNTPLSDVLADVQRKYNVVIKADKNLLNCTLYADFNNMPLQKVLKLMAALINAHVQKEDSFYTLKGKGCN
ncbi:FecR family protein [Mucilaginibacter sp. FT3.2]|uniref:FecR family protein n=1 Tax=Mucilaginibacter sp. FT3.2 TaxID=2723090 RepID=UPI00161DA822|nr:ferric-dicitrate binding protein FerR (iron transport regulator) [Mucilaginibacter sp. FT3.2]